MTAAQRLREEGRQEGRQEGRLEGRLEGRQEGRQEGRLEAREEALQRSRSLLLRAIQQRFGEQLDPLAEQRLRAASLEQVEAWLLRALSAAALAELFVD